MSVNLVCCHASDCPIEECRYKKVKTYADAFATSDNTSFRCHRGLSQKTKSAVIVRMVAPSLRDAVRKVLDQ